MNTKIMLAVVAIFMLLSACKTMETAEKKMEAMDKKVSDADAKMRKKVGLKPYQKDAQSEPVDSN